MKKSQYILRDFLRESLHSYRDSHGLSQENMAYNLHVAPRSYVRQEHGERGFSALTLARYLLLLGTEESRCFLDGLRIQLEKEGGEED